MKKTKSSKSKKLFVKREPTDVKTGEMPEEDVNEILEEILGENRNEISQEMPEENRSEISQEMPDGVSELEAAETGNRIEFEENESDTVLEKPGFNRPIALRDSWPQTFMEENTILVKRTLRSGQCIQFDGNVVVLGDVNPGSEIIASGNIVVMGALRGVVHAGVTGNEEATVSAFKLQPTQLRIANHITRAPDGDYLAPEHPEIARIKDGVVVIEMYHLGQDRQTKIC